MENNRKILIIEDDKYISNFICMSLKQEGYRYETAVTGKDAISMYYANNPDVIILDLGLPDMDGKNVLEIIRETSDKPVIVLSARQEEKEKIKALDMGADDYVVKPFYMGELLARIRVAERKLEQKEQGEILDIFECDYLRIDYKRRTVYLDGEQVHLTPIEYKLLVLLAANRGKVLTHNYILNQIWGYGEGGDSNSLRVFMATLRRKIEKDTANPRFILTEVGVGYRFVEE